MLSGETHVANVAEGVLTFARGQEGVESRLIRILSVLLLKGRRILLLRGGRGCEVRDWIGTLVELVGGLLFLK